MPLSGAFKVHDRVVVHAGDFCAHQYLRGVVTGIGRDGEISIKFNCGGTLTCEAGYDRIVHEKHLPPTHPAPSVLLKFPHPAGLTQAEEDAKYAARRDANLWPQKPVFVFQQSVSFSTRPRLPKWAAEGSVQPGIEARPHKLTPEAAAVAKSKHWHGFVSFTPEWTIDELPLEDSLKQPLYRSWVRGPLKRLSECQEGDRVFVGLNLMEVGEMLPPYSSLPQTRVLEPVIIVQKPVVRRMNADKVVSIAVHKDHLDRYVLEAGSRVPDDYVSLPGELFYDDTFKTAYRLDVAGSQDTPARLSSLDPYATVTSILSWHNLLGWRHFICKERQ